MRRLVKFGLVERRGPHNGSEYRMTDAGRAELARLVAEREAITQVTRQEAA